MLTLQPRPHLRVISWPRGHLICSQQSKYHPQSSLMCLPTLCTTGSDWLSVFLSNGNN